MSFLMKSLWGDGWINFSDNDNVIVIGFYKKGRDNLTMESLKKDLEKAISRKKVDDEND